MANVKQDPGLKIVNGTHRHLLTGTLRWNAPELQPDPDTGIIASPCPTPASDTWAFGTTAWEALTGLIPYASRCVPEEGPLQITARPAIPPLVPTAGGANGLRYPPSGSRVGASALAPTPTSVQVSTANSMGASPAAYANVSWPKELPTQLSKIFSCCWQKDASKRPRMLDVASEIDRYLLTSMEPPASGDAAPTGDYSVFAAVIPVIREVQKLLEAWPEFLLPAPLQLIRDSASDAMGVALQCPTTSSAARASSCCLMPHPAPSMFCVQASMSQEQVFSVLRVIKSVQDVIDRAQIPLSVIDSSLINLLQGIRQTAREAMDSVISEKLVFPSSMPMSHSYPSPRPQATIFSEPHYPPPSAPRTSVFSGPETSTQSVPASVLRGPPAWSEAITVSTASHDDMKGHPGTLHLSNSSYTSQAVLSHRSKPHSPFLDPIVTSGKSSASGDLKQQQSVKPLGASSACSLEHYSDSD